MEACKHWQGRDAPRRRVEDQISKIPSHVSRDERDNSKSRIVRLIVGIDKENPASIIGMI